MDNEANKRSIDDPRYKIPGTNMINFSMWSRENEPKGDHQYAVGDVVVLMRVCEIEKLGRDCDGTPLYWLSDGLGGGYSEQSLRPATEEEASNF